jgi:hypothetical protein
VIVGVVCRIRFHQRRTRREKSEHQLLPPNRSPRTSPHIYYPPPWSYANILGNLLSVEHIVVDHRL